MPDLDGKVVIITGGATGIGRGISQTLAVQGARVAIVQPDAQQAIAAAKEIVGAAGFQADIRRFDEVRRMVDEVVVNFGGIDALVNNAAVTGPAALGRFETMPLEQTDNLVDTNLKGCIWCSQLAAQWMIAAGHGGGIVHIASVGAFAAQQMAAVYCATKAAQVALTKAMALELAEHGIRVNAVAPGDILTERNAAIVEEMKMAGVATQMMRQTPLGRRGSPREIGDAVAFLLSDKASFITGSTLTVDGGFMTY